MLAMRHIVFGRILFLYIRIRYVTVFSQPALGGYMGSVGIREPALIFSSLEVFLYLKKSKVTTKKVALAWKSFQFMLNFLTGILKT